MKVCDDVSSQSAAVAEAVLASVSDAERPRTMKSMESVQKAVEGSSLLPLLLIGERNSAVLTYRPMKTSGARICLVTTLGRDDNFMHCPTIPEFRDVVAGFQVEPFPEDVPQEIEQLIGSLSLQRMCLREWTYKTDDVLKKWHEKKTAALCPIVAAIKREQLDDEHASHAQRICAALHAWAADSPCQRVCDGLKEMLSSDLEFVATPVASSTPSGVDVPPKVAANPEPKTASKPKTDVAVAKPPKKDTAPPPKKKELSPKLKKKNKQQQKRPGSRFVLEEAKCSEEDDDDEAREEDEEEGETEDSDQEEDGEEADESGEEGQSDDSDDDDDEEEDDDDSEGGQSDEEGGEPVRPRRGARKRKAVYDDSASDDDCDGDESVTDEDSIASRRPKRNAADHVRGEGISAILSKISDFESVIKDSAVGAVSALHSTTAIKKIRAECAVTKKAMTADAALKVASASIDLCTLLAKNASVPTDCNADAKIASRTGVSIANSFLNVFPAVVRAATAARAAADAAASASRTLDEEMLTFAKAAEHWATARAAH